MVEWCDDERDTKSMSYNGNNMKPVTTFNASTLAKDIAHQEETNKTSLGYNDSKFTEYKYDTYEEPYVSYVSYEATHHAFDNASANEINPSLLASVKFADS